MSASGFLLTSRAISGAEVVELISGAVLGTVYDTLVDLDDRKVDCLGILPASWYQGGTILAVTDILGYDEGVLLIEKATDLVSPRLKDVKPNKNLTGVKELTSRTVVDKAGHVYGRVLAVLFDSKGKICGLEVEKEVIERIINVDKIIAIGDKYIIVELTKESAGGEEEDKGKKVFEGETLDAQKAGALRVASSVNSISEELSEFSQLGKFKGRRLEFYLDKPSPVSFITEGGETIVSVGERLTPYVLNRLLSEGLLQELYTVFPEEENSSNFSS